MTTHIRLSLYLMDQWMPVLSIPREESVHYTTRPLKWLRYLGSRIYGREGILKGGPYDGEIEDYMIEDVNALLSEYFYIRRFMTPVTFCSSFDDEIRERDQLCVSTGGPDIFCDVVHLIPHKKGDNYIETLTQLRANSEREVIRNINDLRNGMLLISPIQVMLRRGYIGFLKTPNFAMSPEDVPRVQEYPLRRAGCIPPHLPARWTLQYFGESGSVTYLRGELGIHQNSEIFPPEVLTEWPTDIVFDLLSGCVTLHKWGCREAMHLIHKKTSDQCHHASPHASPQSFEQGGQVDDGDQMELDNEALFPTIDDTTEGLIKLWQGLDRRQETEGPCREYVCPQEVQERVSNWLTTQ
ncbi:hypothetical protein CPB86DRAFT_815433 [Serendipita vermifera]|nr:hypothetical protein CPB86DRAFT_815433 [Serendipita vermifera]